jgi:hypothetical protein
MHELPQWCPLDAQSDTAPIEQDAAQELYAQPCDFPFSILVEHDFRKKLLDIAGTSY